ncbi:MAG: hypothetical protein WAV18_15435, partial [Roseiarcus sp.]
SLSPITIIRKYGEPFYIKIDIEHYADAILRTLFVNDIYPKFISAESHTIDVFALLVASRRYNAFKLVEGSTVSKKYKNTPFTNKDGVREFYSFPYDSAGPFGKDIDGEWMTADNFFLLLALEGLGWRDIHATNIAEEKIKSTRWKRLHFRSYLLKRLKIKLRRLIS